MRRLLLRRSPPLRPPRPSRATRPRRRPVRRGQRPRRRPARQPAARQQTGRRRPTRCPANGAACARELRDDGIELTIGYKGEFAANVSGGKRNDATETGQFAFSATLDTDKLFGLKGGTFQTTITYRHGTRSRSRTAGLGTLQQVQEVYGRGQTWRLTEFWYQQELATAAVGAQGRPDGRRAATSTASLRFQNLTFCGAPAGNITGNYWYNYPVAEWSGWAKVRKGAFYLKLGANEDNRNDLDTGFYFSRGGAEGVIVHAEAGWTPAFAGGRLPGRYQAGYWHTSGNDKDVLDDANHRPFALTGLPAREVTGQHGYYVQGEQQLTGEGKEDPISGVITRTRGLNAFFNFTRNDPATATTLDQESIGLYVNAPFAARPKDNIGIAAGRTHYNERAAIAEVIAAPGTQKPDSEYEFEVYYALAAIRGLVLRPNVQYIVDPGGLSHMTDVVVIGGRFDINF